MNRWVLVAEDERQLGEMLCDNLTLEAYHAEHVVTGPAALERMSRGGIDLLILDVMLPGKDGFEVLQELRARGDRTPVLILSARADDQDRIRGLELQADDYLTKPFNLRELLLRVDALLRRSPPTAHSPQVGAAHGEQRGHGILERLVRLHHGRLPGEVVGEVLAIGVLASQPVGHALAGAPDLVRLQGALRHLVKR